MEALQIGPLLVVLLLAAALSLVFLVYKAKARIKNKTEQLESANRLLGDTNTLLKEHIAWRKKNERERQEFIEELEAKNAEMERFTYTVSHDLKSPLITIRGFLNLLEKDAAAGNTDRMNRDMQRIRGAVEQMGRLLDELLELSRVGRLINPPQEVHIDELARVAVEMVTGRIEERGVEVEIVPDMPSVLGDRPRLLEVLQNLIDNAVRFMGAQNEPRVVVGSRKDGEETVYYVKDNGVGVDPRYKERVFDLFERLEPEYEGTGIGLALVKRIIEVHGGRIWIESEGPGQGSAFCFTIPQSIDSAPSSSPGS